MLKCLSIFLLMASLIASAQGVSFADLGVDDGVYQWKRLNRVGREDTECFRAEQAGRIREFLERDLGQAPTGSFQIRGDVMISTRQLKECSLTETIRLLGVDGQIAKLKLEDIFSKNCASIEALRGINVERPFDDENLSFISSTFKFVEISMLGEALQFKSRQASCFYAMK